MSCGCAKPCSCSGTTTVCDETRVGAYVQPRFFSGQLLTQDDLQGVVDYVTAKNRLHNRYLFGTGVACGLVVHCDPGNPGNVLIEPGYALDCCGNDIVLKCQETVDINRLVAQLPKDGSCVDPCAKDALGRTYDLVIEYVETQTEPIAPYETDDCWTSSACEFQRVAEGFRFELRCPGPRPCDCVEKSACEEFDDCLCKLLDPEENMDLDRRRAVLENSSTIARLCDGIAVEAIRDWLLCQIEKLPYLVSCELRCDIEKVNRDELCENLARLIWRVRREVCCLDELSACEPCDDDVVVLASVRVEECKVVEICNHVRRQLPTGPYLRGALDMDARDCERYKRCCPQPPPTVAEYADKETRDFVERTIVSEPAAAAAPAASAPAEKAPAKSAPAAKAPAGSKRATQRTRKPSKKGSS